jgi:hypothetical protein
MKDLGYMPLSIESLSRYVVREIRVIRNKDCLQDFFLRINSKKNWTRLTLETQTKRWKLIQRLHNKYPLNYKWTASLKTEENMRKKPL